MKSKSARLTLTLFFTAALLVCLLVGLSLVTSAAAPAGVAVGPIANLQDDYYTASGTTGVTLVEPGGGYAYYNDGVLELNNYAYEGYGEGDDGHGSSYVISANGDLTIRLVGENTLTANEGGIFTQGNLTITGDGTLTLVGDIDTYNSVLRIEGGVIHAERSYTVIGANASTIELTGGSVTAVCTGTASAFGRAPDTNGMSGAIFTASVAPSGTPTLDYSAGNISTYRYLRVSESRTASFNANTGTGTMAPLTAEYGVFRLPECTFTPPTGKRFKAWAVNSLSGTQVAAGERFDILSNITFYAIWEDDTVTYYYYPGDAVGSPDFGEIVIGGTLELPDCMFEVPAGKQFSHWQVNPGNETKYPGDEITINEETYIIAIWEALVYDVNFDANGGTGTMATEEGVATPYTLPNCSFVAPAGKQFKCWAIGSAEGAQYNADTEIDLTGDMTLYAIWEDIPVTYYTVTFYANGGTGTMAPVTAPAGEYVLPACAFTAPTGKFFTAWAKGSPNGLDYYEGGTYMLTADTAFYALWEYEYYDIMIGNAEITAENNTDVFGDGKVSYDPSTKTLTLNGYSYAGEGMGIGDGPRALIGASVSGLTIRLEGNNTITGTHAKSMALVLDGATTITGNGTLTITTPYMGIYNESMALLTIAGGTLDLTVTGNAEQAAALVAYSLTVTTGGTLKVNSTNVGIYTYKAENLSITGGDITVSVSDAGMAFVASEGEDIVPAAPNLAGYVTAVVTAGVNADGTGAGAYNKDDVETYKFISIKAPTVPGGGEGDNGGGNGDGGDIGNNGGNNGGNTGNGGDTGNNGGNTGNGGDTGNNGGNTGNGGDTGNNGGNTGNDGDTGNNGGNTGNNGGNTNTGNTDNTNTGNTENTNTGNTENTNTDNANTDNADDEKGLGAGAIVAITLGGTIAGGAGIFALVWFAIKKKTWADFLLLFKKN